MHSRAGPWEHGDIDMAALIAERGYGRLQHADLEPICDQVLAAFPDEVDAVRRGKTKVLMRLVGEVMRQTHGRADPRQVTALLEARVVQA